MAEQYDWLRSQAFRDRIQGRVSAAAGRGGMARYQTAIADRLFEIANQNAPILESREMDKTASARRGEADALQSVDDLIKEASAYARRADRNIVTTADLELAVRAKYCRVWPFCK